MKHYFSPKKIAVAIIGFLVASPVFAQGILSGGSFRDIVLGIGKFLTGTIVPIIVALMLVYFLWNMGHYISNMSNEREREQFKKYSINSIIALFIAVSLWGILAIFTGIAFDSKPFIPQFPTSDKK